ncbi:hypothetical protein ROZALSC1DRAFT_29136 [Rozella allomycis CSF55]|uniref:RNI-like protein n=1 Tax=Rozella allomycis (strain CSF55) TaxID=988480 RepID=A0A4P9YL75_ROZAC|nr:hypothetical protein ROZALSC1DRAFT_29136 [Rozella allomycis CSF55]
MIRPLLNLQRQLKIEKFSDVFPNLNLKDTKFSQVKARIISRSKDALSLLKCIVASDMRYFSKKIIPLNLPEKFGFILHFDFTRLDDDIEEEEIRAISSKKIKEIINELPNSRVTFIDFSLLEFRGDEIGQLQVAMKKSAIKEIVIGRSLLKSRGFKQFIESLSSMDTLKSVTFTDGNIPCGKYQFNDPCFKQLERVVFWNLKSHCKNTELLDILKLSRRIKNVEMCNINCNINISSFLCLDRLSVLSLTGIKTMLPFELVDCIRTLPVTTLDLSDNNFDSEWLIYLSKALKECKITTMSIGLNRRYCNTTQINNGLYCLFNRLHKSRIRDFTVSIYDIDERAFKLLGKRLYFLQSLSVATKEIRKTSFVALSKALRFKKNYLTTLSIQARSFQAGSLNQIINISKSRAKIFLKSLSFDCMEGMPSQDIKPFFFNLGGLQLEELCVSGLQQQSFYDKFQIKPSLKHAFASLSLPLSLKQIDFSGNRLCDEDIESLFTLIERLNVLDLSKNLLTDATAIRFSQILPSCMLRALDLECNQIHDLGATHLFDSMKTSNLSHLNLQGNFIFNEKLIAKVKFYSF